MTEKELKDIQYHCSAEELREGQYKHIGNLRVYGHRFMGVAWG